MVGLVWANHFFVSYRQMQYGIWAFLITYAVIKNIKSLFVNQ